MTHRSRARALLAGLLCLTFATLGIVAPAPSPAAAAPKYISFDGRGWGHGIGLSQYGAAQRAEDGQSTAQILAAYYPGTTLTALSTALDSAKIRVRLLYDDDDDTTVLAEHGLRVQTSGGTVTLPTTVNGIRPARWRIVVVDDELVAQAKVNGRWRAPSSAALTRVLRDRPYAQFTDTDGAVSLDFEQKTVREYVGAVRAVRTGTGSNLRTVVVSTIRDYVASVAGWQLDAALPTSGMRASVVAIRTLALYLVERRDGASFFDVDDDVDEECARTCQVFLGRAAVYGSGTVQTIYAKAAAVTAVAATAGRHLTAGGAPIRAEYTRSNGGYSAAGGTFYLRAAVDPYDDETWGVSVTRSELRDRFPSIGDVMGAAATRDGRGPLGGRATRVTFYGTEGSVTIPSADLRLPSTLFSTQFDNVPPLAHLDANRDGDLDLYSISPSGRVYARVGDGKGGFGAATSLGGSWAGIEPVTVVNNLTGTGFAEILAVQGPSHDLVAYPVTSRLTAGVPQRVHTGDWSQFDLFIGIQDFRYFDGRVGLLVREAVSGDVYYFRWVRGKV